MLLSIVDDPFEQPKFERDAYGFIQKLEETYNKLAQDVEWIEVNGVNQDYFSIQWLVESDPNNLRDGIKVLRSLIHYADESLKQQLEEELSQSENMLFELEDGEYSNVVISICIQCNKNGAHNWINNQIEEIRTLAHEYNGYLSCNAPEISLVDYRTGAFVCQFSVIFTDDE